MVGKSWSRKPSAKTDIPETVESRPEIDISSHPWEKGEQLQYDDWNKRIEMFRKGIGEVYGLPEEETLNFGMNPMYAKTYAENPQSIIDGTGMTAIIYLAPAIASGKIEDPERFVSGKIWNYLGNVQKVSLRLPSASVLEKIAENPEPYVSVSKWAFAP